MPRVSDVYAAIPSITGKLELEYEGELQGGDTIARELIRRAAGRVLDERLGGADFDKIVAWFDQGGALKVAGDERSELCLKGFGVVPGLLEVVAEVGLAPTGGRAPAWWRPASWCSRGSPPTSGSAGARSWATPGAKPERREPGHTARAALAFGYEQSERSGASLMVATFHSVRLSLTTPAPAPRSRSRGRAVEAQRPGIQHHVIVRPGRSSRAGSTAGDSGSRVASGLVDHLAAAFAIDAEPLGRDLRSGMARGATSFTCSASRSRASTAGAARPTSTTLPSAATSATTASVIRTRSASSKLGHRAARRRAGTARASPRRGRGPAARRTGRPLLALGDLLRRQPGPGGHLLDQLVVHQRASRARPPPAGRPRSRRRRTGARW